MTLSWRGPRATCFHKFVHSARTAYYLLIICVYVLQKVYPDLEKIKSESQSVPKTRILRVRVIYSSRKRQLTAAIGQLQARVGKDGMHRCRCTDSCTYIRAERRKCLSVMWAQTKLREALTKVTVMSSCDTRRLRWLHAHTYCILNGPGESH